MAALAPKRVGIHPVSTPLDAFFQMGPSPDVINPLTVPPATGMRWLY